MSPDHRALRIAIRQRGAISRTQAYECGYSPGMIRARCADGRWHARTKDVFVFDGFPGTWEQQCVVATLTHPAAAVSHRTSAVQLDLDGFRPGRVQVTVPPTASHDIPIATVHRSRHHQFTVVDGIRTTTFAQTIVQLAGTESYARLKAAIDSGVHADHRRLDELRDRLGQLRDRRLPGLENVLVALEDLDGEPPPASELERLLFDVLGDVPDMPPISRQVLVPWRPNRKTIVDSLVAPWRLVLEADGRKWHTRVQDFELDRWRDAEAAANGLTVMRFTWHRLQHDRTGVVDQVVRFAERRLAA